MPAASFLLPLLARLLHLMTHPCAGPAPRPAAHASARLGLFPIRAAPDPARATPAAARATPAPPFALRRLAFVAVLASVDAAPPRVRGELVEPHPPAPPYRPSPACLVSRPRYAGASAYPLVVPRLAPNHTEKRPAATSVVPAKATSSREGGHRTPTTLAPQTTPKSAPPRPPRHSGVFSRNPVFVPRRTSGGPKNAPRQPKSFLEKTLTAREGAHSAPRTAPGLATETGRSAHCHIASPR